MGARFETVLQRTCRICDKVHQFLAGAEECAKLGFPKRPEFKPGDRLTLKPEVYAQRFPDWPADENIFTPAGPFFNALCKRTLYCNIQLFVELDSGWRVHRYQVCVRWLGGVEKYKASNRKVFVFADDLAVI